jgi:hypothetical protein
MAAPPQTSRTRCVEPLPARVERVGPGVLRVVPERPLAGEVVHGLMLLAFNPSAAGTYPVRLRAVLAADPNAGFVTLGLWPILIESEED